MSDSTKSSPTKNDGVPSLQQMVINTIPLSSIPPLSPAKKVKKASKKEKTPRVNVNSSSPSASIKKAKKKSKKSKFESRSTFTMSELHVDPLPSSGAATPVADPTVENADASGKNSLNQNLDVPNPAETLGLKDPAISGNLGKSSADKETAADKVVNENPEVIIVNETTVSDKWKFVYHRRLALERNLKDDILECQSVVEALEYAASPEYRQVFVRGKCVKFSPTVINQHLQRSSDEVAALKVTDNEVCKVLTGDVARGLGKFIYAVGTKAKFDYGSYFFHETLSHAMTYAVEKPVALPTLLCNIILEQHPDILRSTDVPYLTEASRALKARKLKIDRVIEALKAEEAAEIAEGEPAEQEGVETSGSDDDTEDLKEDSDESSSI
ncbi:uncharacterized protein LOC123886038 [Trifolium pratense]|uniref:uncharacterized protein LOC123886038 n=1 Tax=Trifolium pratense TaxID=57577 RepID=UPI001E6900E1|nr:uncharacterized protein LOC123886038 [Trifolium pratense]